MGKAKQRECMRTAKIGPDLRLNTSQYVIYTLNLSLTVIAYISGLWPAISGVSRVTEARPKSDNRLGGINAFLGIKRTLN